MLDSWLRLSLVSMSPTGDSGPGGALGSPLFLVGMIAIMFYFLLYKPEQRKKNEREKLLKSLARGDEVMTAGGIYGKITALTDNSITIEIAPNVRVKVGRQFVSNVSGKDGAEDKDKEKDKSESGKEKAKK